MTAKLLHYFRNGCSSEQLQQDSDFVNLVIDAAAARRNLRPEQVRLSLYGVAKEMRENTGAGASSQHSSDQAEGLH